jgi:hypothetical protein
MTLSVTTPAWREFDVRSWVRSERLSGRSLVSFAFQCPAPSVERIDINSREANANPPGARRDTLTAEVASCDHRSTISSLPSVRM